MKRAVFISFLLLAHIALLAHAVIPHHHHPEMPATMCTVHHHHEPNDAMHPCGDTDENSAWKDCQLSTIYAKVDHHKQVSPSLDAKFQPVVCLLFLCPDCSITKRIALSGLPFRLKPYIPFPSTEFIARSIGLRAPPVC
ncbi:MAG: hypothetical protein LBS46_00325 [Dysgonamonadaceae bacterium]|jgi:hypothetical protein|nr:hypothetical protein [Dysgonamonadaceae bacterium]